MTEHGVADRERSELTERQLVELHGPLLSGEALWRTLGFSSADALRQAKSRGRLPVKTFKLAGRRAIFARTSDVASWISKLGEEAPM